MRQGHLIKGKGGLPFTIQTAILANAYLLAVEDFMQKGVCHFFSAQTWQLTRCARLAED